MLAHPIENYTFKSSTPTEELEVMCRMLTEVGGYASTFADKAHATQARKCEKTQRRVEQELIKRGGKTAVDEAFATPKSLINADDLATLSIDQLEKLFRQRKTRTDARMAEGRDIATRHFETRIVNELKRRHTATPIEQLKKDYCLRINRQELDNLARLTQMPLGEANKDVDVYHTPEKLEQAITRLRNPKTVMEREVLQAYIDQAIDLLNTLESKQKGAGLAALLIELNWRTSESNVRLIRYLEEALQDWQKHPQEPATKMVLPLLTAYQETGDASYRHKAQRIINRCYKAVTIEEAKFESPSDFINNFYIAVKCCEYVTRFSKRKVKEAWEMFCEKEDVNTQGRRNAEKFLEVTKELGILNED